MSVLSAAIHGTAAFPLDVSLRAEPGITVVFGPSGSGKSTLMRAILGAIRPSAGRIALGERVLFDSERGIDVPLRHRRIGIVFQDAEPFPHMDARRNVAFGVRSGDRARRADSWLARVGASALAARRGAVLSGGERQRIAAIGRDRALPVGELFDRIDDGTELAARRLGELSAAQIERRGTHPTRGEMTVGAIVERMLINHIDEHVEQLGTILGSPPERG